MQKIGLALTLAQLAIALPLRAQQAPAADDALRSRVGGGNPASKPRHFCIARGYGRGPFVVPSGIILPRDGRERRLFPPLTKNLIPNGRTPARAAGRGKSGVKRQMQNPIQSSRWEGRDRLCDQIFIAQTFNSNAPSLL
jgi:hypothetical protein